MAVYKSESYTVLLEMPLRGKKNGSQSGRASGCAQNHRPEFNIFKYASYVKSKEVAQQVLHAGAAPMPAFILLFISYDTENIEKGSPILGTRLKALFT